MSTATSPAELCDESRPLSLSIEGPIHSPNDHPVDSVSNSVSTTMDPPVVPPTSISEANSPTVLPRTGEANVDAANSMAPVPPIADEKVADDHDDAEENEEDEGGKRGRGKPSHFKGARLVFMQNGLKRYMELKNRQEKTKFWPSFMAELMAEFPLSKYPIPRSRLTSRETFVEKTEDEVNRLSQDGKAAYQRSLKRASATDEELYLQMAKDWMGWHQNAARKSEGGTLGAMFRAELEKKKKQIKPQFNHFVMKHPEYRTTVVDRSSETGRLDRLPSRAKAVKDLLDDLPEEEIEALKTEYSEVVMALGEDEGDEDDSTPDMAEQKSRRKNFGSFAQDVLNIWRKLTGLNLVLLAGECIDGDADYDSCVIFSKPDGCPDMDDGAGVDFDRFSNTFLHWLKEIYTRTHTDSEKTSPSHRSSSSTPTQSSSTTSTPALVQNQTSEHLGDSNNGGNRKARPREGSGKKASRKDEVSSGEETPEPSEPSDLGSGSEDEEQEDQLRKPKKAPAPVNSEGLWERNEEGLPVLLVPMCDLTREQQAAFTRECASAIGLTKAVEDLEKEIHQSRKGKKPSVSRYKGTKPTRRSSRIQNVEKAQEIDDGDGNAADTEDASMYDDRGEQGGVHDTGNVDEAGAEDTEAASANGTERVIPSIDNVQKLPAWAQAVVNGYAQVDAPQMEVWSRFDVQGCSTPFLKDYGGWLLGPQNIQRPESWTAVVYKWIEVEEEWNKRGIVAQGAQIKMLKNKRPQGFLQWFKYGRLRWEELVPSEVCVQELGHQWWIWWSSVVNPRWRPRSEGMIMPGGQGDWEVVRLPGKDGFILALVSLRWWCDLLDNPETDLLWTSTLKAVYWTLEELLKDARSLIVEDEGSNGEEDERSEVEGENNEVPKEAPGDKRKRIVNTAGRRTKRRR
ncbi:SERTA domain-containing protein 3 [Paramarasmius palmivorus]|uniref:SERTA domain-containing protein 3 n=1 Tax=Paramarasmius palmivorus TaxID=297713 RepID=A0AAW0B2C3_9AGAR